MTERKIPRVSQRQLRAKRVHMGAMVVLTYAEPGVPKTEYEGILADKRVGATDRESFVELKETKRLGPDNQIAEIMGTRKFTDSYIENIIAAEPRDEAPPPAAAAPVAAVDPMAAMGAASMGAGMGMMPGGMMPGSGMMGGMPAGGGQIVMTPQGPMMMMPQGGGMGGMQAGGMQAGGMPAGGMQAGGMQAGGMQQAGAAMMGQMMMTPQGPVMMMPQGSVPQGAQIVMTPQGPMMMVPQGADGDDDDDDDEGDGEEKEKEAYDGAAATALAVTDQMPFPQAGAPPPPPTGMGCMDGQKLSLVLPNKRTAGGMSPEMGGMWFPAAMPKPAIDHSSKEAVANIANKMADAARNAAAKAAEARAMAAAAPPPPPPLGGCGSKFSAAGRSDGGGGLRFSNDEGQKPYDPEGTQVPTLSSALSKGRYLPSPTRDPPLHRQRQMDARKRSRSRRRTPERRPSPKVTRRRRGGWDDPTPNADATGQATVMAHAAAISTPPPSAYNPLPAAVGTGVRPLFAGIKPGPGGHLGPRTGTPEVMHQAVMRAQEVEAAGRAEYHRTGKLPRGPPDLPIGTAIIEQRYVAYIIGGGGQALAAINQAAGVSCQVDQSTKMYGYSMVNIYGPEEGAERAKLIIAQKIKDYRPKHMQ